MIGSEFGARYVPQEPRVYRTQAKNAQEAHEAIRAYGEVFRTPSELSSVLRGNEQKLYDLMKSDRFVVNNPHNGGVLLIVTWLLASGTVPADLKQALYRALAKIPGLTVTDWCENQ